WSGARQFQTTPGFVTDQQKILEVLTGYIGGSTSFPIHVLRDTFAKRGPADRPAHILIISDDGVTTLFDKDERNASGWDVAAMALKNARGGGTMVLNLYRPWQDNPDLARANAEQGWQIHVVRTWDELVAFARWFSALKYGEAAPAHGR
ncbi:MAG: VWA domain-containing protein, partial [Anaerolineales bacterium]